MSPARPAPTPLSASIGATRRAFRCTSDHSSLSIFYQTQNSSESPRHTAASNVASRSSYLPTRRKETRPSSGSWRRRQRTNYSFERIFAADDTTAKTSRGFAGNYSRYNPSLARSGPVRCRARTVRSMPLTSSRSVRNGHRDLTA